MPQARLVTPLVLHAIKYFDAAARSRSFTRAAEELHVTQGAVSQQIRGLEEQIGARLFNRLARGLALTPEGERLYRVVRKTLQDLETELHAIQPDAPSKTLVIRSSPSFSMMWLMPRQGGFSKRHPEIQIRLRGELFGMSASRMNTEAVDVLILYGHLPDRNEQHASSLMSEYLLPVASTDYLARHAPICQGSDLTSHILLHDDAPWEGARSFAEWAEWLRRATQNDSDEVESFVRHGHQYNLSQLAVNAALRGQGVAMARTSLVVDELTREQLVPAVALSVQSAAKYYLIVNENTGKRDSINAFKDWLVEECQSFESERDTLLGKLSRVV